MTQASKLPENKKSLVLLLYKQYNYIQGILTVEYLPPAYKEGGLIFMKKKDLLISFLILIIILLIVSLMILCIKK